MALRIVGLEERLAGMEERLAMMEVREAQRPGGSSAQATTPLRELPPEHPQLNNLPVRWKHLRPTLGPNALKSALAAQDNEAALQIENTNTSTSSDTMPSTRAKELISECLSE